MLASNVFLFIIRLWTFLNLIKYNLYATEFWKRSQKKKKRTHKQQLYIFLYIKIFPCKIIQTITIIIPQLLGTQNYWSNKRINSLSINLINYITYAINL